MKKNAYFEKNFDIFVSSFEKKWFTFAYIGLIDLIFYALSAVTLFVAYYFFKMQEQKLYAVDFAMSTLAILENPPLQKISKASSVIQGQR